MLNQYKNIETFNNSNDPVSVERIDSLQSEFFAVDIEKSIYFNANILNKTINSKVELHIYSDETWLTGNHSVNIDNTTKEYTNSNTNKSIRFPGGQISIDLSNELNNLKINGGKFNIAINFFENLIGSYDRQHLRIEEISPDRKEIKLRAIDAKDPEFLQQITNYISKGFQTSKKFYTSRLLNFSKNKCVLFVNSVVVDDYLYVKLYEPLDESIDVNFKCWVVEEQKPTYLDKIFINTKTTPIFSNQLSGPNWQANYSYNTSTETDFKNWTDLLGSSVQTSQQIIDKFFSGSLSGMKLNIDYSDFNNFVFYSSATERLENFKYKLNLIEHYTSQSAYISTLSGSVATTNASDFSKLKTNLISGFDDFENYLYYQSSSKLTTHAIPLEFATVEEVSGSYISPIPKSNNSYPYVLYPVTSSQFNNWYSGVYDSASLYDTLNTNALRYAIPEYIRINQENAPLDTFVNMLGHHYDILYTYINHMTKINKREENPKLGMPNELLYSVAKQFGWNLTDGRQDQQLWQYLLGTNESGIPITGSNSVGDPAVSGQDITYAIWRRIVNNLPLLLKSKGTKRSVQALLSCYGIPQSMITIKEYGGPRIERAPVYKKLNFDYSLDLINNSAGTVITNYSQSINSVELRFRTDNVVTNPQLPNTMNLFSVGTNDVTLDFTRGTLGTVQINGTSSGDIELFDGKYLSTLLRTDGTNLQLLAKKSKYGKIVATVSASSPASFPFEGSITLGGTSGGSRLQGQLQELRIWTSSLGISAFENHVKAPSAYDGNIDAYNELAYRLPLTQKINHTTTSSLSGVQPVNSTISSSFASWTNDTPYDSIEETYHFDGISLAAGTFDDNKIRLENNELVGSLDIQTRAESSQYDKSPLDSSKLGVYFSPQTMINEDIIAQLGFTELDQYIGDPGDLEDKSYPDLINAAQSYWKKYTDKNDFNAYIKMFTLFDLSFFKQLQQLLPARANEFTGLLIQPNILERNKDTLLPDVVKFNDTYNTVITDTPPTASGNYLLYTGSVDGNIVTLTGQDDDQYQAYLTSSQDERYNGTIYSRQYRILSASVYITGSTPFWMSEAILPNFSGSVLSEFKSKKVVINSTTSLVTADVQDFLPTGIANQKFAGSKMTSPDFNIASQDTIDGGPVVEFNTANPNQLIYQNAGTQGSFRIR
jgi:hypothetical protein